MRKHQAREPLANRSSAISAFFGRQDIRLVYSHTSERILCAAAMAQSSAVSVNPWQRTS